MKNIYLFITLILTSVWGVAQTQDEVISMITQKASSMKEFKCVFVQQKTSYLLAKPAVSEGEMEYISKTQNLSWVYTKPHQFGLYVDNGVIKKVTDEGEEILDAKNDRMYYGMMNVIMGCASGNILFDKSMFDIDIQEDGDYWKVEMTPKKRDMKRMFSKLTFFFGKDDKIIDRVEFTEVNGDATMILFYNKICLWED